MKNLKYVNVGRVVTTFAYVVGSGIIVKHNSFDEYVRIRNYVTDQKTIDLQTKPKLSLEEKIAINVKVGDLILYELYYTKVERKRKNCLFKKLYSNVSIWKQDVEKVKNQQLNAKLRDYIKELEFTIEGIKKERYT